MAAQHPSQALESSAADIGPLAWVLDETRKSIEAATRALKYYARDAQAARGVDIESVNANPLRMARQQLHQVQGALDMVGQSLAARLVGSMESAMRHFISQPQAADQESADAMETAGFALIEYLTNQLNNPAGSTSALGLFPQYRQMQKLAGAERIHPADLWDWPWTWATPQLPSGARVLDYSTDLRQRLDLDILRTMRGDLNAAIDLGRLSVRLAAVEQQRHHAHPAAFWLLAAGFFEALGHELIPLDLYAKRAASGVLSQYTTLSKNDDTLPERLANDLLFFCAQAHPIDPAQTFDLTALTAVRAAWGLERHVPIDYSQPLFGLYDPNVLVQACRRVDAVKEHWSALAGGDMMRLKACSDQINLVAQSLAKLLPKAKPLADELQAVMEQTARANHPPSPELALETATAVLFLEASFADFHPADALVGERMQQLAERLHAVRSGAASPTLEPWMEDLYRQVSDRQTMGTVVGELRATMGELEGRLDQFFRNPADKTPLAQVPDLMHQMRGVLSVLGLDPAVQAVTRMREQVDGLIANNDTSAEQISAISEQLGNSIGSLGFLVDMLGYQPMLARKLFVYDAQKGELKAPMERARPVIKTATAAPSTPPAVAASDTLPATLTLEPLAAEPVNQTSQAAPATTAPSTAAPSTAATAAVPSTAAPSAAATPAAPSAAAPSAAATAATASQPAVQPISSPGDATASSEDDDLLDIFLQEASEVIAGGQAAIEELRHAPTNTEQKTTLRRAFHTLKGSARMVGLAEFGEAAWALEQVLNTWLAEQKPADENLRDLSSESLNAMARWTQDIAAKHSDHWSSAPFRNSADALRLHGQRVPLDLNAASGTAPDAAGSTLPELSSPGIEVQETSPGEISGLNVPDIPDTPDALPTEPIELPTVPMSLASADSTAPADAATDGQLLDFNPDGVGGTAQATSPAQLHGTPSVPAINLALLPDLDLSAAPPTPSLTDTHAAASHPIDEAWQAGTPEGISDAPRQSAPESTSDDVQVPAGDAQELDFSVFEQALRETETPQNTTAAVAETPATPQAAGADDAQAPKASMTPAAPAATPIPPHPEPPAPTPAPVQEEYKQIGPLRISTELYNVYLEEADGWSSALTDELTQWSLAPARPAPEDAIAHAHSLAGSSATVGLTALSTLARAVEHALERLHEQIGSPADHLLTLSNAATEIRNSLHQFAAGLLREPSQAILDAVNAIQIVLPGTASPVPAAVASATPAAPAPLATATPAAPMPASVPVTVQVAPATRPTQPSSRIITVQDAPQHAVADNLDAVDAVDADLFPVFSEEAEELLPQLASSLRTWIDNPADGESRKQVLRFLHTLKGSARLAGALRLGEMAHRTESAIEIIGTENIQANDLAPIQDHVDEIEAAFQRLQSDPQGVQAQMSSPATLPSTAAALTPDTPSPTPPAAAAPAATPANPGAIRLTLKRRTGATQVITLSPPTPSAAVSQPGAAPAVPPAVPAPTQPSAPATSNDVAPSSVFIDPPAPLSLQQVHAAANQVVRVKTQLLDRLVNQAGEIITSRSRLEAEVGQLRSVLTDLTGNLERLRSQLRDVELQAESQMQSRMAQSKDDARNFDPLEFDRFTRMQEITRMMAESVNDVATVQRAMQRAVESSEDNLTAQARQTHELQHDLLRTRMVEFESISERLYRVVRQAAKDAGKQVRLDIVGGAIEVDRGILDRMTGPFEHLLRNSVVHGVEAAPLRIERGKDATGVITIEVQQVGNDVDIEFRDDGNGLDLQRIRQKAEQQGLIQPGQQLSEEAIANLVFASGLSTAGQISQIAGRGVGMDVVRTEVQALGGHVETRTQTGHGAAFRLVLPLTTAVTQVVMLRAGKVTIGVPSNLVEIVRRVPRTEIQQAYDSGQFSHGGIALPFFWSGALLQSSPCSQEPPANTLPVVIFRSAAQRIALHVDEILGNQEVVVKPLGPQLSRLPGLVAITALASGAVALIYNPVALATVYGTRASEYTTHADQHPAVPAADGADRPAAAAVTVAAVAAPQSSTPLVLVVDDSITVRRVTQRLLQREGYRVALAADGLQGLEQLQKERPVVVLSDIEMPRMDGFDFVRNIRADARLHDLPVIMITSRIAEKHHEHALELGVNHYLGKPYSEEQLLALVHDYATAVKSS